MLTACLSYLPYDQFWIYLEKKKKYFGSESNCLIGCSTNRGKINVEIYFENLVRYAEKMLLKIAI
jgi:uncharacterized radical SAM superfamily protein